jgi:hypothetical protein
MLITKTESGYRAYDGEAVLDFPSLEKLFRYLLRYYEGRSPLFAGDDSYGSVRIFRNPPEVFSGRR